MKEILRRSITGVIYIVLLLSAVFLSSDAFDFLFMIFGLACIYEYKRLVGLKGYYIFLAYLVLWWIFIYLVKDIKSRLLMSKSVFDVEISELYERIEKPKAKAFYSQKASKSWEDVENIKKVDVPWYRSIFE